MAPLAPLAVASKVVGKGIDFLTETFDGLTGGGNGGISQGALAGHYTNAYTMTPGRGVAGSTTFTDPSTISANFGGKNMDTMGNGNVDAGNNALDNKNNNAGLTIDRIMHDTTKTVNNWVSGSTNYGSYIFDE